ncbi:MAG TPA: cobalt-precorrin-5B (C(1))-methyltransferase [Hyphomicrobiales bacterium]|nr:cobalt-precorrin-5B (C(1))-methyltransferase [Hyphomicrobiales bacterium]
MASTSDENSSALRRGWTTGACAAAAAKSAYGALLTGSFADPVSIRLPKGEEPAFALAMQERGSGFARAGIVKDAGDDPDVTHGALIMATVRAGAAGSGVTFRAGKGVGTVTKPGLPVAVGEPAINPAPRAMMREVVGEVAAAHGASGDVEIEISVKDGERIAARTWNPRLGILGGLSILGTTGIVHPFSCSAWIHAIQRGIDVARAAGIDHIAGATGSRSEDAVRKLHGLPEAALIDMGDFVGGMLKYVRSHPVPRVSIAGGFAKMCKLGQGLLDLHSARGEVSFDWLAEQVAAAGGSNAVAEKVRGVNTAAEALELCGGGGPDLAAHIAELALATARRVMRDAPVEIDIVVIDREGGIIGRAGHGGGRGIARGHADDAADGDGGAGKARRGQDRH